MEIKDCTEKLAWCLKMPLSIAGIVVANVGHDGQAIHFVGVLPSIFRQNLVVNLVNL